MILMGIIYDGREEICKNIYILLLTSAFAFKFYPLLSPLQEYLYPHG